MNRRSKDLNQLDFNQLFSTLNILAVCNYKIAVNSLEFARSSQLSQDRFFVPSQSRVWIVLMAASRNGFFSRIFSRTCL